jgi:gliding motility-associated lipoprotein GldD
MTMHSKVQAISGVLIITLLVFSGCSEAPVFKPKPRSYPRVVFPEKRYQDFEWEACDFFFRLPAYATLQQDKTYFNEAPPHPCWFDIYFEDFDCRLHCSYLPVGSTGKNFEELKSDVFDMANWHNKKANYIDEHLILNRYGANGISFSFDGPVASPYQFFLTDEQQQHFFRAALYFNTEARPDSLKPVLDFLMTDIDTLISSFRWEEAR